MQIFEWATYKPTLPSTKGYGLRRSNTHTHTPLLLTHKSLRSSFTPCPKEFVPSKGKKEKPPINDSTKLIFNPLWGHHIACYSWGFTKLIGVARKLPKLHTVIRVNLWRFRGCLKVYHLATELQHLLAELNEKKAILLCCEFLCWAPAPPKEISTPFKSANLGTYVCLWLCSYHVPVLLASYLVYLVIRGDPLSCVF